MKRNNLKDQKISKASKFITKLLVVVLLIVSGCEKENHWDINSTPIAPLVNNLNGIISATMSLGRAANFAVLATNTVVNSGESIIVGDVGVGSKSTTGLKSRSKKSETKATIANPIKGDIIGTLYTSSALVNQAHNDAVLSYHFLINQNPDIVFRRIVNIDNQTFSPGIYHFPMGVILNINGTLTLDFQGNDKALFIFQIGNTLTTMPNSNIVATNTTNTEGAGENIFWAVDSSVNIEGNTFLGNIIALSDVLMSNIGNTSTITNVFGRIITLNGSVTMNNSNISIGHNTHKGVNYQIDKPDHFITGGGWFEQNVEGTDSIFSEKTIATFGLSCGIKNGRYWGLFSFVDQKYKGTRIKGHSITAFTIIDKSTREIKGVAKVNNRDLCEYTLIVKDNGANGNADFFDLKLSNGFNVSGTLGGGKIQLHDLLFD